MMSDHLSTQELIQRVEIQNRKFKIAQTVFMTLLLVSLCAVITLQFQTLNNVEKQLAEQTIITEQNDKTTNEQTDKIIRRLDCMVAFFSQTDRVNLTIADIEKCSLNRDGSIQQFSLNPESTPSAQSPDNTEPNTSPESRGNQ